MVTMCIFCCSRCPRIRATKIVRLVKSLTAKQVLLRCPQVKKKLWGGEFWSDGYFISTVGQHSNAATIGDYVRHQGTPAYQRLHQQQLVLFGS